LAEIDIITMVVTDKI